MTIAADSGNESRNIVKRASSSVGDAVGELWEKRPDTDQVMDGISSQTTRVGNTYDQLRGRDYVRLAELFNEWAPSLEKERLVAKELAEQTEAFLAGVANLSETEKKDFVRGLHSLFDSLGLDLNWILDPEMSQYVEAGLQKSMVKILHMYCLSYWLTREVQGDVEVLVKLQKWMDKPDDKKNAKFNQMVFTRLVAEDLIPSPPIELFLASDEERREYSVNAVKEFIKSDPQRFYELLKMPAEPVEEIVILEEDQGAEHSEEPE